MTSSENLNLPTKRMATIDATQNRDSESPTDPNNNLPPSMKSYSLRPRAARKCDEEETPPEPEVWRPSRSKRKQKPMPLSKYRRKTANARERSRMREINEAFESLRRVIPQMASRDCSSEKLTKITTLRLAMKYISALDNILHDQDLESDGESLFSDYTLTPPDVRELSITSPATTFTDHSLTSDFFSPLLPPDLTSGLVDNSLASHFPMYPETTLPPVDASLSTSDSVFDNSSYVFDENPFLTDFS